jgi:hypothetical protein
MDVPLLPDDILRRIHYFYALEKARSTGKVLQVWQHETASAHERRVGNARGWRENKNFTILRGSLCLTPISESLYNFTALPHPAGIGIMESNRGEGFGSVPFSFKSFVGILPWGDKTHREFTHAGWSRATRSVSISLPVWNVPRAWGFEGFKAFHSKVIVTDSDTERPDDEEGIVDPAQDPRGIVRLQTVPEETRSVRWL